MIDSERLELEVEEELQADTEPEPQNEQLPKGVVVVDSLTRLRGVCNNYVSAHEKMTRQPLEFEISSAEHPNREMVACYLRNTEYNIKTVRKPEALRDSFHFLVAEHLGRVAALIDSTKQRNQLIYFLHDRMVAVRCEYHVQGILDLQVCLELIKVIIFLETLGNAPVRVVGLEDYLLPHVKAELLLTDTGADLFREALELFLVKASKLEFLQALSEHWEQIAADKKLMEVVASKRKILSGNYRQYFKELATNPSLVARLLYWSQYEAMRDRAIACYRKSGMNERAPIICKILCYRKMEGWVNVSNEAEWKKLQQFKVDYDLPVKLWVGEKLILQGLQQLIEKNKGS